jgi:hypothetical protein
MKQVFNAEHPAEAHTVRTLLEEAGIPAEVSGESLFGLRGMVGMTEGTLPSVWIYEDGQKEAALAVVAAYQASRASAPAAEAGDSWQCPKCGEMLEGQFGVCWQCHAERPVGGEAPASE